METQINRTPFNPESADLKRTLDEKVKAEEAPRSHGTLEERNHKTHAAITIGREPAEVFAYFRDFSNLPRFMKDVTRVEIIDAVTSDWTVTLKSGHSARWTAKIVEERPGEKIAWKSVEGSEVETTGKIWFSAAPSGLGTVVELAMTYRIPGGKLAEFITTFTGESPQILMLTNLRRLKAVLETGEYPTVEGQPSGREELPETFH